MKKTIALILALTFILAAALCGCGEKAKTAGEFTLAATLAPEEQQKVDELLAKFMTCYEENNAKDALLLLTDDFGATVKTLLPSSIRFTRFPIIPSFPMIPII